MSSEKRARVLCVLGSCIPLHWRRGESYCSSPALHGATDGEGTGDGAGSICRVALRLLCAVYYCYWNKAAALLLTD